jgi:glycosyltransferase involved in cell wall biosynthesis
MKLLVLAQTPPPVHGQSLMVQAAVEGLPRRGIAVEHVNLRLSRDTAAIGRWDPGKILRIFDACVQAIAARIDGRADTLYYVPAPAKRGALYRDWLVLSLCRPFYPRLVLHWHASGLGEWLERGATPTERWLSRRLLGGATLAVVLGENLRADASQLAPKRIRVVRNGIDAPARVAQQKTETPGVRTAVFLGLCVREKGVFDAIEAVRESPGWQLVIAGATPDKQSERELSLAVAQGDGRVEYVGFLGNHEKHALLSRAHALVFPTYYRAETQGLVVAEALAHDLPVVITDWRAVSEKLPREHVHIVAPRAPAEIAKALRRIADNPAPRGELRQFFEQHLTLDVHLDALAAALKEM